MTNDPLKDLLMEAAPPAPPAFDMAFSLDVMKKVERRRLFDGLAMLTAIIAIVTMILFIVMPYITPAIVRLGEVIAPAVAVLTVLALSFIYMEQIRRFVRI